MVLRADAHPPRQQRLQPDSRGHPGQRHHLRPAVCPLKITQRGTVPLKLPTGELRQFLADGDEIILRAHCHREGLPVIAFDECRGTLLPAI